LIFVHVLLRTCSPNQLGLRSTLLRKRRRASYDCAVMIHSSAGQARSQCFCLFVSNLSKFPISRIHPMHVRSKETLGRFTLEGLRCASSSYEPWSKSADWIYHELSSASGPPHANSEKMKCRSRHHLQSLEDYLQPSILKSVSY